MLAAMLHVLSRLQSGVSRLGSFSLSRIASSGFVPPSLSFSGNSSDGRGQKGGAIWMDNKAVNKVTSQRRGGGVEHFFRWVKRTLLR